MAVGGSFDMIAGVIPRAPLWMQTLGIEWLYRLIREPWRWKRQEALLNFLSLVFKEKFFHTR
jgi:N-acetylglucosaminyldiphosphoundecaprenol N-acetyl-beta-D-mannosaminyltransferase